jgi:hypothetical protein
LIWLFGVENCELGSLIKIDSEPAKTSIRPRLVFQLFVKVFLGTLKKAIDFNRFKICRLEERDYTEVEVFQRFFRGIALYEHLDVVFLGNCKRH